MIVEQQAAGCRLVDKHDVNVARCWTAVGALVMSFGTVASWYIDGTDWALRGATLVVPMLALISLHGAGAITWNYNKHTAMPQAAYQGISIEYIDEERDPATTADDATMSS